jgi:hypothetical protein
MLVYENYIHRTILVTYVHILTNRTSGVGGSCKGPKEKIVFYNGAFVLSRKLMHIKLSSSAFMRFSPSHLDQAHSAVQYTKKRNPTSTLSSSLNGPSYQSETTLSSHCLAKRMGIMYHGKWSDKDSGDV